MTTDKLKLPAAGILLSVITVIFLSLGFMWTWGISPVAAQCRETRAALDSEYVRKADLKASLEAIEKAVDDNRSEIRKMSEKATERHLELMRAIYKKK
jgi:hypothetical protein